MFDLAKALRNGTLQGYGAEELFSIVVKASAEIERLEGENERLREGLRLAKDDLRTAVHHIDRELEPPPGGHEQSARNPDPPGDIDGSLMYPGATRPRS